MIVARTLLFIYFINITKTISYLYCSDARRHEPTLADTLTISKLLTIKSIPLPQCIYDNHNNIRRNSYVTYVSNIYTQISKFYYSMGGFQLSLRSSISDGEFAIDMKHLSFQQYKFSFNDMYLIQENYHLLSILCASLRFIEPYISTSFHSSSNVWLWYDSFKHFACSCYNHENVIASNLTQYESFEEIFQMIASSTTDHHNWCISKKPVCTSKSVSCKLRVNPFLKSCIWIRRNFNRNSSYNSNCSNSNINQAMCHSETNTTFFEYPFIANAEKGVVDSTSTSDCAGPVQTIDISSLVNYSLATPSFGNILNLSTIKCAQLIPSSIAALLHQIFVEYVVVSVFYVCDGLTPAAGQWLGSLSSDGSSSSAESLATISALVTGIHSLWSTLVQAIVYVVHHIPIRVSYLAIFIILNVYSDMLVRSTWLQYLLVAVCTTAIYILFLAFSGYRFVRSDYAEYPLRLHNARVVVFMMRDTFDSLWWHGFSGVSWLGVSSLLAVNAVGIYAYTELVMTNRSNDDSRNNEKVKQQLDGDDNDAASSYDWSESNEKLPSGTAMTITYIRVWILRTICLVCLYHSTSHTELATLSTCACVLTYLCGDLSHSLGCNSELSDHTVYSCNSTYKRNIVPQPLLNRMVKQRTVIELAKLRQYVSTNKEDVSEKFKYSSVTTRNLLNSFSSGHYSGLPTKMHTQSQ